ncbi:MAG TPA: Gfo/Idh/MocA family oxidoreductase [Rhizorhapis sp.]
MTPPIRIGIIGYGKIARDQHIPAIQASQDFQLAAISDPKPSDDAEAPFFQDYADMLAAQIVDAVAICTPPAPRHGIALACLETGYPLLLEKPPTVTLGEMAGLAQTASRCSKTLFTTWHAQYNTAVEEARVRIAQDGLSRARITWIEDVRKWHPGQDWIWKPGGFGVFDPGINALSLASLLFPGPLTVSKAELDYPSNSDTPIAAILSLMTTDHVPIEVILNWRTEGEERWEIDIVSRTGSNLKLQKGGSELKIDGSPVVQHGIGEYPAIYQRFAHLLRSGQSHVDVEPLRLVADAFLLQHRRTSEAFQG